MFSLEGRVALVTGASRGIGQATAIALAKQGAFVYATATTEERAASIQTYFEELGLAGTGVVLDVTKPKEAEAFVLSLAEQNRSPLILVNNAGIKSDNLLLRMGDDEWYNVLETNLTAVYRMTKICLKAMFRVRWGRVISIGSVVGSCGNPGQSNYTASKAGLIGFTKSVAQEIASRGITLNVVAPGFIDTDMTQTLPDLLKEDMLRRIPARRMGKAEDIASAVVFLASDEARYITGETIHVNGGMYMN